MTVKKQRAGQGEGLMEIFREKKKNACKREGRMSWIMRREGCSAAFSNGLQTWTVCLDFYKEIVPGANW